MPDSPSRYNTKIREIKVSAEPVSGCSMINITGIPIIKAAIPQEYQLCVLTLAVERYCASNRQVANLANSDGCNLKLPIGIQAWLPPTFLPTTNTATSNNKVMK